VPTWKSETALSNFAGGTRLGTRVLRRVIWKTKEKPNARLRTRITGRDASPRQVKRANSPVMAAEAAADATLSSRRSRRSASTPE